MKLTKEEVEPMKRKEYWRSSSHIPDLCDDWLAMRAMLESLESVHFCPSCKADRGISSHKDNCKLKELLG